MTTIDSTTTNVQSPEREYLPDEPQLAAAAFLARYGGRTLDAYHHDLRGYFQWASDVGLDVLDATRPHIESSTAAGWRSGNRPRPLSTGDPPASQCEAGTPCRRPPVRTSGAVRRPRPRPRVFAAFDDGDDPRRRSRRIVPRRRSPRTAPTVGTVDPRQPTIRVTRLLLGRPPLPLRTSLETPCAR